MKKVILLILLTVIFSSCTSDNELSIQNTTSLDFTEVVSFQVDTLELDLVSNINENSLYITYSGDSGFNENVLKYNTTTSAQNEITHPDISESRQIEIINNLIYSISSNDIYTYDLNLDNVTNINNLYNDRRYLRTSSLNNDLLIIGGTNQIVKFDTSAQTYDYTLTDSPYEFRDKNDGEILNNNIYIFGGRTCNYSGEEFDNQECDSHNEITIYNLLNDNWTNETIPYQIHESFTELYGNKIIVAGNKNSNQTNSFIAEYIPSTNTYSNIQSNLDLNDITIRGVTILNNEIFIAYIEVSSFMSDLMTVKIVKAPLL